LATRAGIGETLQDDVGRREAILERGVDADELIPLLDEDRDVDHVAQQRVERPVIDAAVDPVQRLVDKVLDPRYASERTDDE
jgi:hypothetical protein